MMKTGGLNHECLLYSAGEQWTCTNQPSVYLTDIRFFQHLNWAKRCDAYRSWDGKYISLV